MIPDSVPLLALSVANLLVCANDELAQELVAETVEVITVKFGRLLALEVSFCGYDVSKCSKFRDNSEQIYHIC